MNEHAKGIIKKELEHLSTKQIEQIYEWYTELVYGDDAPLRELDLYHAVVCREILDEREEESRDRK